METEIISVCINDDGTIIYKPLGNFTSWQRLGAARFAVICAESKIQPKTLPAPEVL
jgi:hypothetical protein